MTFDPFPTDSHMGRHKTTILYALFGCIEMISRIEVSENSKFMGERKWLTI
jgi:hypothetical protein